MPQIPDSLKQLTEELSKLPGIGHKSAQRLALHLLKVPKEEVLELAHALVAVREKMRFCTTCWTFTETDPCAICSSPKRNPALICVVEEPSDVIALEKTNEYAGLYHVLGGSLSPLDGIGPEDLKVKELLERIKPGVAEIILALNPNVEGGATTIYLTRLLRPLGVKITRLARGIPIGGDLEMSDEATLSRALEGRVTV